MTEEEEEEYVTIRELASTNDTAGGIQYQVSARHRLTRAKERDLFSTITNANHLFVDTRMLSRLPDEIGLLANLKSLRMTDCGSCLRPWRR